MDVKTAFHNGYLNEEIYMEQPEAHVNVSYALAVGSIMYAVRCTRPDVAFAQNVTSRFQQNPGDLKRELRVSCYTDAGYLTDADDLKSQTRYVFVLNGGVVDWKSVKQSIFATSSAEAEYIAAFDAFKEAVRFRKFIYGLGVVLTIEEPISMYCDNTGAIVIANESGITKGARHFRVKVHYLCEVIEYGDIKLEKFHIDDNLADPFTKPLAFLKHSEHTRNIGMLPASSLIDQVKLTLGVMDLDHALRIDPPAALTAESTADHKRAYEQWERSNRMSLMIIKNSISATIRGVITDFENAKEYLSSVEKQLKGLQNPMQEERLKVEKPDVVHVATTNSNKRKGSWKGKGSSEDNSTPNKVQKTDASTSSFQGGPKCKFCHKKGHIQKDCPKFKEWSAKKGVFESFMINESFNINVPINSWWIDSESMVHIANLLQGFRTIWRLERKRRRDHGIINQYTMSGTPQQNGVAERRNHTLMDMVLSMLANSNLPEFCWTEERNPAYDICGFEDVQPKLASNNIDLLHESKHFLPRNFDMKDLGEASYVIGIEIHRDRANGRLGLSQKAYIEHILNRFNMQHCSPTVAPVIKGDVFGSHQCPKTEVEYEEMR
nr:retrotransposon protein, putative, Ty1-copia subclass [Tanacetum cinerariifolium]